jgi:alginate O-acetyltransferase complex protein AlgI
LAFYEGMAGFNGFAITDEVAWRITGMQLVMLVVAIAVVFIEPRTRQLLRLAVEAGRGAMAVGTGRVALVALFGLAVLKMSADSYSPFLYFQF